MLNSGAAGRAGNCIWMFFLLTRALTEVLIAAVAAHTGLQDETYGAESGTDMDGQSGSHCAEREEEKSRRASTAPSAF